MAKPYTAAELRQFDLITMKACSHSQMDRIRGRLAYTAFAKKHGARKVNALIVAIKDKDNKRRRHNV